jgi:anti-sigma factor RsiW
MNEKMLELLYRSFDDRLTEEERTCLEEALSTSEELRAEKERVTGMRKSISSSAAASFEPFFAERVMNRIRGMEKADTDEDLFFESLYRMFRPLALAASVVVFTLISLNLRKSDNISLSAAFAVQEEYRDNLLQTPLESFLEESL